MEDSTAFPWLKDLSEDGQREFWTEMIEISVQAMELDTPIDVFTQRMEANIAAWKSTAEAWADPEVRKVLTSEHNVEEDFVEVTRPEIKGASADYVIYDEVADVSHGE